MMAHPTFKRTFFLEAMAALSLGIVDDVGREGGRVGVTSD